MARESSETGDRKDIQTAGTQVDGQRMRQLTKMLGAEIRKIRKGRHMTQQRLGEKAGITGSAVSQMEGGKIHSVATLHKLCTELRVSMSDLMKVLDSLCDTTAEAPKATMPEILGSALRKRREALGLTVEDLAAKTGLSRYIIYTAEEGTHVRLYTVYTIAIVLEMRIDHFFGLLDGVEHAEKPVSDEPAPEPAGE